MIAKFRGEFEAHMSSRQLAGVLCCRVR
jgi:hypothetical protein